MANCRGISVIITHYAPPGNSETCLGILKKTIDSIRRQQVDFDVEIILCDDGSAWSSRKINEQSVEWCKEEIENTTFLNDLLIDKYLFHNSEKKYWAVRLKRRAYEVAKHEKIVILDDDHSLIGRKALLRYYRYLDRYQFVRGRVIGADGIPQIFKSRNVQGTNYGLRKNLFIKIGGYGKYLDENGFGEDDDIFWRVFQALTSGSGTSKKKKACFAGEIVTKDAASKRYVSQENQVRKQKPASDGEMLKREDHIEFFRKNFIETYGISPGENLSRDKSLWMEFASFRSWMSEIYFFPIYHVRMIPVRIQRKMKRFRRFLEYCQTRDGRDILKGRLLNLFAGKK